MYVCVYVYAYVCIYMHNYSSKNPTHCSKTPPVPVGTFSTLRSPTTCCPPCSTIDMQAVPLEGLSEG